MKSGELVGRESETAIIDPLVDQVRDRGGSLLIRGEPGIGKSALLDRARARGAAMGAVTLATIGVESEAELAYAGLHQLLLPIFELATQLPRPQRRAIDAVFGVADDAVPDLFRVAMASFRLLTVAAESAPLIVGVDDAHWLDHSSVRALAFIARRLDDEPMALLVAVRAGYRTPFDDANLPVLELERLSPLAAGQLLDQRAPNLHPIVRARVLTEGAGNPLALVELARTLPSGPSAGRRLAPTPTTLTARLERAFATRLHELPQPTRAVLLAAALDSRASVQELIAAASLTHGTPVEPPDIDPAIDTGFVDLVDGELGFRHPLMRSAVRQAASSHDVVQMYGALASSVSDAERRLWHHAMAATGADEHIARELETYARSAMGRGAVTVAAAALERAVALTADRHMKGQRLVSTAELAYELGRTEVVSRLVQEAKPLELDPPSSARLTWLNQMTTGDVWFEPGAAKTFVTIAREIADGGDSDSALRSLVPVAHRSWWTRPRATTRRYLVDAAQSLAPRSDDPRVLAVEALADPEVTGPSVLRTIRRLRMHDVTDAVDAMYVGIAAEKAGDFALGSRFLARAVAGLREQTRLGVLTQALVHHAWAATYADEWSAAAASASEGAVLARDTNQPPFGLTGELIGAIVAAMRGTHADIDGQLAAPERAELAIKGGPLLAPAHIAKAAAALGDGRHDDAFRELWPVFDEANDAFHRFMRWPTVVDLVEAAAGSGQATRVVAVIDELDTTARRSEPPILLAGLSCARPLLASDAGAEALFEAALAQDLTEYPFLRARTLFAFGRWLRRQRRSADSRAPLRRSIELFDALGAARWGARARDVLRASGETVVRRAPDARDRLTAQEMQIAQLAAQGLSNREIAERLFVSHRTIGSHLYHIFPKLGITARTQLRDVLATAEND
jgi:DNA-binding CsgD family transcriptional regulator